MPHCKRPSGTGTSSAIAKRRNWPTATATAATAYGGTRATCVVCRKRRTRSRRPPTIIAARWNCTRASSPIAAPTSTSCACKAASALSSTGWRSCKPSRPGKRRARQIFLREIRPLALLVLALQNKLPSLCFGLPGEGIAERTVRVFKNETDRVAGAGSVAQRFREPAAINVQPVRHVALAGVVVAHEDDSLIVGRPALAHAQELMIQSSWNGRCGPSSAGGSWQTATAGRGKRRRIERANVDTVLSAGAW